MDDSMPQFPTMYIKLKEPFNSNSQTKHISWKANCNIPYGSQHCLARLYSKNIFQGNFDSLSQPVERL